MSTKFDELPKEKQERIINAGMEVFAESPDAHASCDTIATKAGMAKGLLFYYFKNKKEFYLFILDYVYKMMCKEVADPHFYEITDFFELLEYAACKKCTILTKHPYITDFVMRIYYSENESISPDIHEVINEMTERILRDYFNNIDYSKFRDDVDPFHIMKMMIWAGDGYLRERRRLKKKADMNDLLDEFNSWISMFKRMAYKEAYLND